RTPPTPPRRAPKPDSTNLPPQRRPLRPATRHRLRHAPDRPPAGCGATDASPAAAYTLGRIAAAPSRNHMSEHAELRTVASVDIARYMGTWYEIARLPMRHEPEDGTDI